MNTHSNKRKKVVEQYSPWNLTLCGQEVTYVKFHIYIAVKALICGKQDRSNVTHSTNKECIVVLYMFCFWGLNNNSVRTAGDYYKGKKDHQEP